MESIINVTRKKDTYVIAIMIFYESKKNPMKVYRMLSCVLYYVSDNYVCFDYLCYQSKKLSSISSDKTSEQASYNVLLGIDIP